MTKKEGKGMGKVVPFEKCPYYNQEGKGDIRYQKVLPKGEIGNLDVGYVRLKGPAKTVINTHTEWHQIYLVISGSGTVVLDDKEYRAQSPCLIRVPAGTKHFVNLSTNEEMSYVYVNESL